MSIVSLEFTHPNLGQIYHRELWEVDEEDSQSLRNLIDSDDAIEELQNDMAFDEDSPNSHRIKQLLARGKRISCEPHLSIPVYWERPSNCECIDC